MVSRNASVRRKTGRAGRKAYKNPTVSGVEIRK